MKNIKIKKLFHKKNTVNAIILAALLLLTYLLISIYFSDHFFFNTEINGVNMSLKPYKAAESMIRSYIKDYKLKLIERNGESEEIVGQDIGMGYNENNSIYKICNMQNGFKWIESLLKSQKYYVDGLFTYNEDSLQDKINELNCLNKDIVEPKNVGFKYTNGSYEIIKEVYGNKLDKDKLNKAIKVSILGGEGRLDLNERLCYENPRYTLNTEKTFETYNLLSKYASSKITYVFEDKKELLDGYTINKWLSVNEDLEIIINEIEIMKYIRSLSRKYDTVGIARNFNTSTGKKVEVVGGLYGWKINTVSETKALLNNIKLGEVIEKEPQYLQKALPRGDNEIGNTYLEINITRQHVWFYKDGKLITQGSVVTGNPNRGHSTVVGTYMLNYKQKGATLTGPGYEAPVTYWMPFFGNIGIHDATWRHSFGGQIYKRNGSHGCVNAPLYLAKTIFENIEDGTPIISYEE